MKVSYNSELQYLLDNMAKSQAKYQRAYRDRKKQREGESYLARERERRRRNNIPSSDLSRVQLVKKLAEQVTIDKKYREKKVIVSQMNLTH